MHVPSEKPACDVSKRVPLFQWEPGTEQEVVCLFGYLLEFLPIPLKIDEVRTAFPDCLATRTDTGQAVRIEFELYGSHFRAHRHDPNGCDVVICWVDDHGHWPSHITMIELAKIVEVHCPGLIENPRPKREPMLWEQSLFDEEATPEVKSLIAQLMAKLDQGSGLQLRYNGRGKEATCNICMAGTSYKLLWIWADGRYQWCWEGFREERPDVVRYFQGLVGSKNISSSGVAKPKAMLHEPAEHFASVLTKVVHLARQPVATK